MVEGASTFSNSVWLVRGGGAGIGSTNDGFHFLYQPCVGNVQMTVKLLDQTSASSLAKAGLMISETLNPAARSSLLTLTPDRQLVFQNRSSAGNNSQVIASANLSAPCWLRLIRNGNAFTAYSSTNNTTWNLLNSATIPGFNSQAYIGLVVTAGITNVYSVDDTNFKRRCFQQRDVEYFGQHLHRAESNNGQLHADPRDSVYGRDDEWKFDDGIREFQ
ncbi:MAG: hypothetical protein WDN00_09660 [Limisphaerales bacterium]